MRAKFLLSAGAVAVLASTIGFKTGSSAPVATTKGVSVRIDCLANRGVSFSLVPWSIPLNEGDSIYWYLDKNSGVDSISVIDPPGRPWPFKRKGPYKSEKGGVSGGGGAIDPNEKGRKYKYAVQGVCLRSGGEADTVLIDPDMIIVRGGGT